jgi:hypothetical protein
MAPERQNKVFKVIAIAGTILTLLQPIFYFGGFWTATKETNKVTPLLEERVFQMEITQAKTNQSVADLKDFIHTAMDELKDEFKTQCKQNGKGTNR